MLATLEVYYDSAYAIEKRPGEDSVPDQPSLEVWPQLQELAEKNVEQPWSVYAVAGLYDQSAGCFVKPGTVPWIENSSGALDRICA